MWQIFKRADYSPYRNMAFDEALIQYAERNRGFRAIRFFRFKAPGAVSIASYQDYREANPELGIPFVRRPTSGRGLYHHPTDLGYSMVVRKDEFGTHRDFVEAANQHLVAGFKSIGIDAKYNGSQSIVVDDRKITGSARNPWDSPVMFQHGSIFFEPAEIRGHAVLPAVESSLFTSVREHVDIAYEEFERKIMDNFPVGKVYGHDAIPLDLLSLADRLEREKYSTDGWNKNEGEEFTAQRGNCAGIWRKKVSRPQ